MASFPSNSTSEPAIIDQVVNEFFAKSLHIILESRSPYVSSRNYCSDHLTLSTSSSSSGLPRDKWFNLALRDCPAALENFDLWRQSNLEPLVVDVILTQRQARDPWGSEQDIFLTESKSEKIVERWIVQYESRNSSNVAELHTECKRSRSSSQYSETPSMYKKTYKRTIVLLRSLYSTVRLLPAYKVFRDLNSSGRICPFSLSHKISSFVEPFSTAEDAAMNRFSFVPVDTPCGRLSLSVSYVQTLKDVSSEPSTPISAQFIPDYVGSPTTDRLKKLHSLPSGGSLPTYISFSRRHSWSNDHGITAPLSSSPSPTYSDPRGMHCNRNPALPPRSHPPDHLPSTCPDSHNASLLAHKNNTSFDEYWPWPTFSPSASPSPPSHSPGSHLQNALPRSESAPLSILWPRLGGSSGLGNQALPPSPSRKSWKAGCLSQRDIFGAQADSSSPSHASSPESKLQVKKGLGEFHVPMNLQKILYSGKDESGRKMSSCTSPCIPSRSSSRVSFLDEFDDSEFVCPFAVDDEDLRDFCRAETSAADGHASTSGGLIPVRRSPDAAVGALVRMLKTAAPLREDFANSAIFLPDKKDETSTMEGMQHNQKKEDGAGNLEKTASGIFKSRTAADALEELGAYRKMKERLISEGGSQLFDIDQEEKSLSYGSKSGFESLYIGQAKRSDSKDSSEL